MRDSPPELQKLVRSSNLIFSGTVFELGTSSVPNLAAHDDFAVVRIDRPMRSDPALGDLRGRVVTVKLLDRGLQLKERVIFFTLDWIQGLGIAVRELAHLDLELEEDVAAEVAHLPERHLAERLGNALLVAVADVTATKRTPFDVRWRNAPQWAAASLRIVDVLHGQPGESTTVLFPTSGRPTWARSPRLTKGQLAIFLLHSVPDWPPPPVSGPILTSEAFTVLDPADVQPESQRPLVERLLSEGSSR